MSLLSVNMGFNEACQKNLKDVAKPQERVATGGRCFILVRLKPEWKYCLLLVDLFA